MRSARVRVAGWVLLRIASWMSGASRISRRMREALLGLLIPSLVAIPLTLPYLPFASQRFHRLARNRALISVMLASVLWPRFTGVEALLTLGRKGEAIQYAEALRD